MEIVQVAFDSELGRQAPALRVKVFVEEQGVPADAERDHDDAGAAHFVAVLDGEVVGTLRVVERKQEGRRWAKIGRVAVAEKRRGEGIGRKMMAAATAHARRNGIAECYLTSQVPVIGFYEKLGFKAEGPVFDECGIAHRTMRMAFAGAD